jgi:hypothetical protein
LLRRFLIIPALLICGFSFSQQRSIQATKTEQAPKIDGNLDDPAWKDLPVAEDFIQNFPTYGLKATAKTEVKIVYTNSAIFVGAYIHDDPSLTRKQITPRDGEQQSDVDYFSVFFDTYNDHQNGFQFLVTSMNVQTDARLASNLGGDAGFGSYGDKSWDAVWDSKVSMKNDGWVVEMKIPYISLRFAKKDLQDWGLQFLTFTRRNNERGFWSPVDPNVNGFVNQFGDLNGLQNIEPPLRLSFSPYISTGVRSTPVKSSYSNEWLHNGGMDVKYGINESFTLDATLIPDFGQVVSDPQINNLTPYEIKFQENRPFFTEGTELFNKAGLFYSRRVGAVPPGYYDVLDMASADSNLQIVKNPALTQLYNAIKLSGRTKNKLGIGVFNAITAPMHAILRNKTTKEETRIETSPLANYNLFVLDQALKGRSYLTLTNASTIRNSNGRDANVSAFDFALYDKRNAHVLQGTARYSKVWEGSSYDGYNMILHYGKIINHWQWFLHGNVESEDYDPNDLGFLIAPNEVSYRANLSYNIFAPTENFITYRYFFDAKLNYLQKPYAYSRTDLSANAFWWFKNFWDVSLTLFTNPGWTKDYFELRTPGRYLAYPVNYVASFNGSSDSRKKLFIEYGVQFASTPEFENKLYGLNFGIRYRFSDQFILDLENSKAAEYNQMGYAFEREINNEPIVAFRDNTTLTTVLSGIYHFTPRMNINLRARHYWNKVEYKEFFNVDTEGKLVSRAFIPDKNENVNIFNFDAFLNWDFRLGSRLIVGYKNWLGNDEVVDGNLHKGYVKNLRQSFSLRHGNELSVKFIYFLDYNQLRKK